MKYILLIVIILILLYSSYAARKNRDLFDPALIFVFPVFLSFLTNLVYYDKKFEVSSKTYAIYLISMVCFILGIIIGEKLKIFQNEKIVQKTEIRYNKTVYKLFWFLAIVGVFFAIEQIIRGQQYGIYGKNLIDNVRHYTQYVERPPVLGEYGIVFADMVMLWLLYKVFVLKDSRNKSRILLGIIIIIYNIYMATVFSRTNILYEFIVILFFFAQKYMRLSNSNRKQTKWFIIAGVLVLIMLFSFNFIAQKTNKTVGRSGESWWAFYLGSQFYIFDKYILKFSGRAYGINSFGIIGRVLYKLEFLPMKNIHEMQNVLAKAGNPVSSFASAPYMDFGILGSVIIMLFYGIAIGYIHKRYLKTGGIWIIVYATCVSHCILAFYAFVFGGSNQVYDLILLFLMCKVRINSLQGVKIEVPLISNAG